MKDCDYLLPPGEEVCAGSAAEAFALFRTVGVDIRQMPVLGTIRRRSHPQTAYCVWADCEKEFHVLPLFPAIGIPECGDWEFAPLESGEMIMYVRRRTYLVGYDKISAAASATSVSTGTNAMRSAKARFSDIRMPAICCAGCS